MTNNPNELTIENSVLVLIDHQPAVALSVHSINWAALGGEWAPEYGSPEAAAVASLRGGSAALGNDYVMAQVAAGLVPLPDFLADPVPAGAS